MTHFPNLDDKARDRLAERGVDADASFDAFMVEVRVGPPPRLLRDLGLAPIVDEHDIRGLSVRRGSARVKKRRVTKAGPLSGREAEVLTLAAAGRRNADIAAALHISAATVKAHIRSVIAKLAAKNQTNAVAIAIRQNLI